MNTQRYQAGRCDAHGNRVIADDLDYMRGWFAAFMNLDNQNPFEAANDLSLCPLDRVSYVRACLHIDRLVHQYFIDLAMDDKYEAFERGKACI